MLDALHLIGGLFLLYFGAEWLVAGAARLGRSLGISTILIGLTIVAYGTSTPEVVVSIEAAMTDHPEVALGNVIGSNIANLALILGLTALVLPPRVDRSLPYREVRVLVVTAIALPLVLLDGVVAKWEGALLLFGALVYTVWMIRTSARGTPEPAERAAVAADAAATAGVSPVTRARAKLALLALLGLVTLVFGGSVFVEGATGIALALGLSERIVGLTIVAVGTSLPELATSLIAAFRGHSDIAVGNVIGSNIFNVLLCTGAAAVLGSVGAPFASLRGDLLVLVAVTLVGAVMMRTERTISRLEGGLLVAGYAGYVGYLVYAG